MTAFVIPNAIQLTTCTTKSTFTSFLARDTAYDMIFNIWRLAHPKDGLSEDEHMGCPALEVSPIPNSPLPNRLAAISVGSVVALMPKVTYCVCGRENAYYSELTMDGVIPSTPEQIYNLMFASGFLKGFMHKNQKLEGMSSYFLFPL